MREKILAAAFELFLSQGVAATTIEEICERADVANRTFFNHFATRQDMIRALAERRLVNLHDVVFDRALTFPFNMCSRCPVMVIPAARAVSRTVIVPLTFTSCVVSGSCSTRHAVA